MAKAHLESPRESVIPAKAGIHFDFDNSNLDPGFRRDGEQKHEQTLRGRIHVKHGYPFKSEHFSDKGEFIVLTPGNFWEAGGFKQQAGKEKFYDAEFPTEYLHKRGDLIVAMTEQAAGLLGSMAFVPEDNRYLHNQRIGKVTATSDDVYLGFLYYAFRMQSVRTQLSNTASGSKVRHTSPERIYEISIPLPPAADQKHIAAVLSALDAKIDLNNRINAELEALAKTIYDYWFVQFDFPDAHGRPYRSSGGAMVWNDTLKREIPAGWVDDVLGNIVENLDSKRVPLSRQQREQRSGSVPYYGATGLMGYVDDFLFDEDLLLLAEDGSVMDDRGKVIVQRVWGKAWVNNHAHVLRPSSGWTVDLLYHALRDVSAVRMMSGSIQKKITQDNLNATRLLVPPESLRRSLARSLRPIRERQKEASEESAVLTRLRDWLLPLLMNGQVRVAPSSDAASAPALEPVAEPA